MAGYLPLGSSVDTLRVHGLSSQSRQNWWPQSPTAGSAGTALQTASLPLEGSLALGGFWQWQCWNCRHLEKAQVSSYCSAVSSHCVPPGWNWVGENVPPEKSCSSSKGQDHAGEEKGRGLPAKLGPGEQLFSQSCSPQGEAHSSFLHPSCEGGSFWGGHPPNLADIMSPGVKLPRVLLRVSFPFLASESQKLKWLIWTNTAAKGFQFCLSVLIGTVYCRLRGQRDFKRGETTTSAH